MHRRKYILYSVISTIDIYYNKLVLPFNLSVIIYMRRTRICFIIKLFINILSG